MTGIDPILSEFGLYITNEKGEWVDFQRITTKNIYNVWEHRKPKGYTCADRWLKAYDGDEVFQSEQRWRAWHTLPYKISHEVQLQSFAYKIWYRTIPCKVYLKQIRVQESNTCSRCSERDDMFHFFFECSVVKSFWDSLATWMGGKEGIQEFPEDLTEEEFLLGIIERQGDFSLFNYILLFAKFFIYKATTFTLGDLELFPFLIELKSRLNIERLSCFSEGSFTRRFRKWDQFYHDL